MAVTSLARNKYRFSYATQLWLFSILLLILKLILFPFVDEIDADAVSRVYLSLEFADSPHLIKTGNWPPLYFYLMGGALKLYNNQFFTPVFVNILLSSLLLIPLFYSLKRLFEEKVSFLLCVFFSFSPIVFRMSMLAMSEISYIFFVILSINVLLKGLFEKKNLYIFLSAFFMGLAGGIRYESWLLGSLIILYLVYLRYFKESFLYAFIFVVIPLSWILLNYIYAGDPLNSFNWAIELKDAWAIHSFESLFRKIWWYPLSLMFAFGPVAFFFFIRELKNYKSNKISFFLFLTFIIFLTIWLINSIRGSLLLQHRFSITLYLLSFSFLGYYFSKNQKRLYLKTTGLALSAFLLAFVYSSKGARPIPMLLTDDAKEVSDLINKNITANSGFICDFWNWETTYFLPFSTNLPKEKIEIIESYGNETSINDQIYALAIANKSGVMLVNKNNTLFDLLKKKEGNYFYITKNLKLELETIFENKIIICFTYTAMSDTPEETNHP